MNLFWKVIIRYGHVGCRKDVAVARHLKFSQPVSVIDVIHEVSSMPGTKNISYRSIYQINEEEYVTGKLQEKNNFYLQNLFSHSA